MYAKLFSVVYLLFFVNCFKFISKILTKLTNIKSNKHCCAKQLRIGSEAEKPIENGISKNHYCAKKPAEDIIDNKGQLCRFKGCVVHFYSSQSLFTIAI